MAEAGRNPGVEARLAKDAAAVEAVVSLGTETSSAELRQKTRRYEAIMGGALFADADMLVDFAGKQASQASAEGAAVAPPMCWSEGSFVKQRAPRCGGSVGSTALPLASGPAGADAAAMAAAVAAAADPTSPQAAAAAVMAAAALMQAPPAQQSLQQSHPPVVMASPPASGGHCASGGSGHGGGARARLAALRAHQQQHAAARWCGC